jgi:hypothetical protein
VALHLTREFKYGDFRPGAESDGENGGSNAAVDIELAAGFFVPSAEVATVEVTPTGDRHPVTLVDGTFIREGERAVAHEAGEQPLAASFR